MKKTLSKKVRRPRVPRAPLALQVMAGFCVGGAFNSEGFNSHIGRAHALARQLLASPVGHDSCLWDRATDLEPRIDEELDRIVKQLAATAVGEECDVSSIKYWTQEAGFLLGFACAYEIYSSIITSRRGGA